MVKEGEGGRDYLPDWWGYRHRCSRCGKGRKNSLSGTQVTEGYRQRQAFRATGSGITTGVHCTRLLAVTHFLQVNSTNIEASKRHSSLPWKGRRWRCPPSLKVGRQHHRSIIILPSSFIVTINSNYDNRIWINDLQSQSQSQSQPQSHFLICCCTLLVGVCVCL